jgi:RNA polymerase sigma factor (sigma-70 family)
MTLQVAGRKRAAAPRPLAECDASGTPRAATAAPATRRAVCSDRRAHAKTEGLRLMNATPIRDDEQLIELFLVGAPDEAESAFQALVKRHRPAVMRVCRRVLRTEDAEDAAQVTFVQLVRNAGRIRNRRVLGAWLRDVAFRVAIRMKHQSVRRRAAHDRAGGRVSPRRAEDAAAFELRQILRDEVHHLPKDYRTVVVRSYLEGRSNEEVARILNRPIGTIKGRLWRARGMLRERLLSRAGRAVEVFA